MAHGKKPKKKVALITGITGQDGSYLTEILLEKDYEVHGLIRRSSTWNRQNIEHIFSTDAARDASLHYGDMGDLHSLVSTVHEVQPDEVYNLAAQSHVQVSFEVPFYTANADAVGVLGILEAVRLQKPDARIYQASTSEMYSGDKGEAPQDETTRFKPRSPYGVAKLYGFEIARVYRESYGMFVTNGILFNHESPRRGHNFVTRKVVVAAIEIARGTRDSMALGNLDAHRDWGYAPEYMEAAWKMLQLPKPDDFVIATGETHSVRDLAELALKEVGIAIEWRGKGVNEHAINVKTGKKVVTIDRGYFRPNEVSYLCGNLAKAKKVLGWKPKTTFKDLVRLMVKEEQKRLSF